MIVRKYIRHDYLLLIYILLFASCMVSYLTHTLILNTTICLFSTITSLCAFFAYYRRKVGLCYFFLWMEVSYLLGYLRLIKLNIFCHSVISSTYLQLALFSVLFILFYSIIPVNAVLKRCKRTLVLLDDVYCNDSFLLISFIIYILFYIYKIYVSGGFYSFIFMVYAERHDPTLSYLTFLQNIVKGSFIIAVYTSVIMKKSLKAFFLLFLLFIIGSIEGSSGFLLNFILPVIIYYLYDSIRKRKYSMINKWTITAVILLSIFLVYSSGVRVNRGTTGDTKTGFLDSISEIIYGRTFDAVENSIRIREYYKPGEHLGTHLFIYPFLNFIPRAFWHTKPIGLGKQIMYDLYDAPENTPVSFSSGVLGESYIDFGYIGIIVYAAFLSIFVKISDEILKYSGNRNLVGASLFSIQLCLIASNIPGSPEGYLLRFVIIGIFQVVYVRVIGYFINKTGAICKSL